MAARANITINDGETSPVAHVYTPMGDANGAAIWRMLPTSGVAIGAELLNMQFRDPLNGSPYTKVRFKLWLPTLEVPSGGTGSGYVAMPTLAYANQAELTFLLHQRATLQERKNLRSLVTNLMAIGNPLTNAVQNLENVWG